MSDANEVFVAAVMGDSGSSSSTSSCSDSDGSDSDDFMTAREIELRDRGRRVPTVADCPVVVAAAPAAAIHPPPVSRPRRPCPTRRPRPPTASPSSAGRRSARQTDRWSETVGPDLCKFVRDNRDAALACDGCDAAGDTISLIVRAVIRGVFAPNDRSGAVYRGRAAAVLTSTIPPLTGELLSSAVERAVKNVCMECGVETITRPAIVCENCAIFAVRMLDAINIAGIGQVCRAIPSFRVQDGGQATLSAVYGAIVTLTGDTPDGLARYVRQNRAVPPDEPPAEPPRPPVAIAATPVSDALRATGITLVDPDGAAQLDDMCAVLDDPIRASVIDLIARAGAASDEPRAPKRKRAGSGGPIAAIVPKATTSATCRVRLDHIVRRWKAVQEAVATAHPTVTGVFLRRPIMFPTCGAAKGLAGGWSRWLLALDGVAVDDVNDMEAVDAPPPEFGGALSAAVSAQRTASQMDADPVFRRVAILRPFFNASVAIALTDRVDPADEAAIRSALATPKEDRPPRSRSRAVHPPTPSPPPAAAKP